MWAKKLAVLIFFRLGGFKQIDLGKQCGLNCKFWVLESLEKKMQCAIFHVGNEISCVDFFRLGGSLVKWILK